MSNPKLFISYDHSNFERDELVLQMATDLRESGVEVILDKWDLKPSEDAKAFMEKILADSDLKKIIIISDKSYVEKASDDKGEDSQIISKDIYEKVGREKFALVMAEKDEKGKPFIPEFYQSGIFADLSQEEFYSDEFEKLLRWSFDEPLYAKPLIGEKPEFLGKEIDDKNLGTHQALKKALEAIKNHHSTAEGRIDEYLTLFAENLERFRITEAQEEMDKAVYENIKAFKPFRNEYLRLLTEIVRYKPRTDYKKRIQIFIEDLISYTNPPENNVEYIHWGLDNFMFISHEIFLYTLAVFLKYEQFREAAYLLKKKYYVPGKSRYGQDETISFDNLHRHLESLEKLNERLKIDEKGPRAKLLKNRCAGSGLKFRHLMQADFTAFLKAELYYFPYYSQWYPETLKFLGNQHSPFEMFMRAKSRDYFDKLKVVLDIQIPMDLEPLLNSYEKDKRELPRGMNARSASQLTGFKTLASLP